MAEPARAEEAAPRGPTLATALSRCFDPSATDGDFAREIVALARALTTAPAAFCLASDGAPLASSTRSGPPEAAQALVAEAARTGEPAANDSHAAIRLTLPSRATAALVIQWPAGGSVAASLAAERLGFLSALSGTTFGHPDLTRLLGISGAAELQTVADDLAALTDADYAAIARMDGDRIEMLAISGQQAGTTRAALPDTLRKEMTATAARRHRTPARVFAGTPGHARGIVVHTEGATRNPALPAQVAAILAADLAAPGAATKGWRVPRILYGLAALALIALIPIPDGRDIPATVEAASHRLITAPYAAVLAEVAVADTARVTADETILARLDVSDIALELIGAQADYARAVLDRETARAGRDATALRTAELEAERIRSRITLLEARRDAGVLIAPISGVVIGDDLAARQGATLRQGEVLMEVADPGTLRLDLYIADEDIGDLAPDAAGVFRPDFDPALRLPARITTISPAVRDSRNVAVFAGKATFDEAAEMLSPGMAGVLAVERSLRPIGLIVYDALRDWFLLRVWL